MKLQTSLSLQTIIQVIQSGIFCYNKILYCCTNNILQIQQHLHIQNYYEYILFFAATSFHNLIQQHDNPIAKTGKFYYCYFLRLQSKFFQKPFLPAFIWISYLLYDLLCGKFFKISTWRTYKLQRFVLRYLCLACKLRLIYKMKKEPFVER